MCDVLIVDGEMMMIRARGHATGSQDCCSGISTILYSLAGYLRNDPQAQIDELTLQEAEAGIVFRGGKDARGAFLMAKIGLMQLEKAYGEYMRVNVME